jgi:hypothetical protein
MATTDLSGVELKIGRAKAHLADLKDSMEAVVHPDRYRFDLQYDAQTQKHVYTVHNVPAIPPAWSLTVGEILYNLRSALDHLAWQLVLLDGGNPGDDTQFPVRASPFDKKGQLFRARLIPPVSNAQILDTLEECQPYRGPDGEPAAFTDSPLWQLHRMNIIDKHRLLLVVVCVLDVDNMYWGAAADDPAPSVQITIEPAEEGAPVAWFDFHGAEPPADFDPHPALAVALHEGEFPEISLLPIHNVLSTLVWWVEWHIVGMRFRPLFP